MFAVLPVRWHGCLRCGAAAIALACIAAPQATGAKEAGTRFDIPAQDMAGALEAFSRQAGVQILFPYAIAAGRRSGAVNGTMPPRTALERLLRGSGIAIVQMNDHVVTLRGGAARKPARRTAPPTGRAARPPPSQVVAPVQDIIVTGRLSPTIQTGIEASFAVSEIDRETLVRRAAVSTAEVFKEVPGFWVESTGGQASNNVRARGIPTDGYSSVTLMEDGLPVQYDGGLAYLNTDQSYRIDASIVRAEAIRGGPSAVFLANAPGGGLNFMVRDPVRDPAREVRISTSDRGMTRLDGMLAVSPAPNLGLLVAGFWRRDPGLRDPGFTADEGGQFRARAVYDDGETRLSLDLRHLDDSVILYLPVPLATRGDGSIAAVPGFDPLYDTLAGPDTRDLVLKTPHGAYPADLSAGTRSHVTSLTFAGRRWFGEGGALEVRARWRREHTLRNGLFPVGRPVSAEQFVAENRAALLAAFPHAVSTRLGYVAGGAPFGQGASGNGLVMSANLLSVDLPLEEGLIDARIAAPLQLGGRHDLALGATWARTDYRFDREMGTLLLDVSGQAGRLDLLAVDGEGAVAGSLTDNGFIRYGSLFDAVDLGAANLAVYAADEWHAAPRWRVDLGVRLERTSIRGHAAGKQSWDLGDPGTLADDDVIGSDGTLIPIRHRYSALNWSLGVNFEASPSAGFFARISRSRRLPSASAFNDAARSDQGIVPIVLADAGLTVKRPHWQASVVGFYTRFDRLAFTDYRFSTETNTYVERTSIAATETVGLELSGRFTPAGPLSIAAAATLQDPRYREFRYTELVDGAPVARNVSGNQLVRVPRLALRIRPELALLGRTLRIAVEGVHYSGRYADIANTQRLPAYGLLNASLSWQPAAAVSVTLEASNLTNTLGLTEGNPRAGSFDNSIGQNGYFFARPEFGRTLRLSVTLR